MNTPMQHNAQWFVRIRLSFHRTFLHILSREALSNWSIINKEKNSFGGIGYLPFLVYIYIYKKCVLGLHMKPRKISIMENNFYVKGHDHVNSINDLSTNLIYVHHWERPPPTPSWGSSPFPFPYSSMYGASGYILIFYLTTSPPSRGGVKGADIAVTLI